MNLLMLILIFLALLVCAGVFYAAWRLSSTAATDTPKKEEPGDEQ
jgi:flagellar basal body-associated protein FliL